MRSAVSLACLAVMLTGCSALMPKKLDPPVEHTLFFDREGKAADPTGNSGCERPCVDGFCHGRQWSLRGQTPLGDELYGRQILRMREAMEVWGRAREPGEPRKLFLFVHGGLNSRSGSLGRAARLQAQVAAEAGAFPIFVNWRSSFRSSYAEHLLYLRQGKNYGPSGLLKAPFYLFGDLARGIVRIPLVLFDEVKNLNKARGARDLNDYLDDVERDLTTDGVDFWRGEDCESGGQKAFRAAEALVTIPTTKLVTGAVLEGFGEASWDVMQRRTDLLFYTEEEMREIQMVPHYLEGSDPQGHFAVFLRELVAFLKAEEAAGYPWTVDLVGHSMGTIVVNDVVRYIGDELPIENIVYMAAACRLQDYQEAVVPLLVRRPEVSMYHLTLHPKADLREAQGLHLAPRGSLLVWLDDFLSAPQTPFERVAGRYDTLLRVMHLMPDEIRDRVHVKALGVGSSCCHGGVGPVEHGEFGTRLRFWRNECWQPRHGMSPAHCFHQEPLGEWDEARLPATLRGVLTDPGRVPRVNR